MIISIADALSQAGHAERGNLRSLAALLRAFINGEVANKLAVEAGAGITGGVGAEYKSNIRRDGLLIKTQIYVNLKGLASSTTDLDVIGVNAVAAHLGKITAAVNGVGVNGRMLCLETPAGGADDIDLYSATVATAVFDDGIAALTETAHITAGGAWVAGIQKNFALAVPADNYLYLTGGEAGTAATYTAGKFLIELSGYLP